MLLPVNADGASVNVFTWYVLIYPNGHPLFQSPRTGRQTATSGSNDWLPANQSFSTYTSMENGPEARRFRP